MILRDIVESDLKLLVINKKDVALGARIKGGYTSDLLSQVLAKARGLSVWITIQNHMNIIGVATMLDLKAIIICEDRKVPEDVIDKADEEGIVLLSCPYGAYKIGGELFTRGL